MNNRVIYFEIPADDTEASKKFFAEVFGWGFRPFGEADYWQAMTGDPTKEGIDGAIMKKVHPNQPLINSIQVEDVDATLRKVEEAGGKVVIPKMVVPMVGWLAYIEDPSGYMHGVVQIVPNFDASKHMLKIERTFVAPVERVWEVWTKPELVKEWWGPKGFTAPMAEIDLKVGGEYFYCMRSPEGKDYYSKGTYREIVPLKRISALDSFADDKGNIVPATYYGMSEDFPKAMIVTVAFEPTADGQTKFTLWHQVVPNEEVMIDMRAGWNESLDKLASVL